MMVIGAGNGQAVGDERFRQDVDQDQDDKKDERKGDFRMPFKPVLAG